MSQEIIAWEHLRANLKKLNVKEMEIVCELGTRRIRNCLNGRSTLKEDELKKITEYLNSIISKK